MNGGPPGRYRTDQIKAKQKSLIDDRHRRLRLINLEYRDLILHQFSTLKRTTWVDQPKNSMSAF